MNTLDNSVAYLTILNKTYSPGVYKKILGTLKGAKENGFRTRVWCKNPDGDFIKSLKDEIDSSPEKILIIRSLCEYNIYLVPNLIRARKAGKVVIIDVPTPNRVAVNELFKGKKSILGKTKSLLLLILSGSIPYIFSDRIIQYAREGWWFYFPVKNKSRFMGNGIDVETIPLRANCPKWPSTTLNFIAVASLNYWHGLDRFMHAMHDFNQKSLDYKIKLMIVGEGAAYGSLKKLAEQLKISDDISFKGFLQGEALYRCYEESHIGIGSLALFRKNLQEASELKAREYASIGLPFISTGKDPDFSKDSSFRFEISNEEDVSGLIDFFHKAPEFLERNQSLSIREFAKNNLDFKVKFQNIVEGLI